MGLFEKDTRPKCPLMMGKSNIGNPPCLKEECQLWIQEKENCAIVVIAKKDT